MPVFCWELPPDHVAMIILGCLAAVSLVLRGGLSLGQWGGVGGGGKEWEEEKQIAQLQRQAKCPKKSALSGWHRGDKANVLPWPVFPATPPS